MAIATLAEVKTYLGITGSSEDAILNNLLSATEEIILSMLQVDTLAEGAVTEKHDLKCQPYHLRGLNPHGTPKVNTVPLTTFDLDGYMLRFTDSVTADNWGRITIEYTGGYETIPEDIKHAQKIMVAEERTARKSAITEFRQGDLTVKYGSVRTTESSSIDIGSLLKKYKRIFVCS